MKLAPRRRSTRLLGFDYASEGAYFITICADRRRPLFDDGSAAAILTQEWESLPLRFPSLLPDAFVVMPNHVHFIVWLTRDVVAGLDPAASALKLAEPATAEQAPSRGATTPLVPTLAAVVGAYKSLTAKRWLSLLNQRRMAFTPFWQRNYYDRIIRNQDELNRIREYIALNPSRWHLDNENPDRVPDPQHDLDWDWLEGLP